MKRMMKLLIVVITLSAFTVNAQDYDKKKLNWYNGAKFGMSTDKAYKKLLSDKKSETTIVAVIDSGVDIEHEDLKGKIWTNKGEIPDNGIDDDKNGYIDDVHGWSFLGNPDGENIEHEQLEMTRMLVRFETRFDGKSEADIEEVDKEDFATYISIKEKVESKFNTAEKSLPAILGMLEKSIPADSLVKIATGKDDYTVKDLDKLIKKETLVEECNMLKGLLLQGATVANLLRYIPYLEGQAKYHYNKEYDARKIVGDDPSDFNDKTYGCNDVEGPDAMHGTHCSGIIGATRGNEMGNDGVADNILIMSIRAVPDGDERDKDIALAIRYAVDNGASVVNMSFGKSYSPYKAEVIAAIRYAEEKGVLLVHAAGNDGKDIGEANNFPSPMYPSMSTEFTNWLEIGASTRYKDALAASFSNYSDKHVDIYAPGLEIYSTVPQSEYQESQGTSMAAPMVTGLAALLKSYFPKLTMFEIRDIILKSAQDVSEVQTPLPGDTKLVPFAALCETGGIANTYTAVEMAIALEAKK